jgi:nitrous oxide reductase accessory protein NosL
MTQVGATSAAIFSETTIANEFAPAGGDAAVSYHELSSCLMNTFDLRR